MPVTDAEARSAEKRGGRWPLWTGTAGSWAILVSIGAATLTIDFRVGAGVCAISLGPRVNWSKGLVYKVGQEPSTLVNACRPKRGLVTTLATVHRTSSGNLLVHTQPGAVRGNTCLQKVVCEKGDLLVGDFVTGGHIGWCLTGFP